MSTASHGDMITDSLTFVTLVPPGRYIGLTPASFQMVAISFCFAVQRSCACAQPIDTRSAIFLYFVQCRVHATEHFAYQNGEVSYPCITCGVNRGRPRDRPQAPPPPQACVLSAHAGYCFAAPFVRPSPRSCLPRRGCYGARTVSRLLGVATAECVSKKVVYELSLAPVEPAECYSSCTGSARD